MKLELKGYVLMSRKNRIAILGAGRLGKGFLGAEFLNAGWNVDFYDIDKKVIDNLKNSEFTVDMHTPYQTYKKKYSGYGVYDVNDDISKPLSEANVIAIDTYPQDIYMLYPLLGKVAKDKLTQKKRLSILVFTNKTNLILSITEGIKNYLNEFENKEFDTYVEVKDAIIIRSTFAQSNSALEVQSLAVTDSIIEKLAYNDISNISGICESDDVHRLKLMKLFTLNGPHAAYAYSGFYCGLETMNEAELNPFCQDVALGVAKITKRVILNEYKLKEADLNRISISNLAKDPILDSIKRVACNPIRKLAYNDRLVYPAVLALQQGENYDFHAKAIALGLLYVDETDEEALELQAYLKNNGIRETLERYSQLNETHDMLIRKIMYFYEGLKKRR